MFEKVPFSRFVVYLLIAGAVPVIFSAIYFFSQMQQLDDLEANLEYTKELSLVKEMRQAQNSAVRQAYKDSDHFYIDKHLESLVFLQSEQDALMRLVDNKNFAGDEQVNKRLEFLTDGANTLLFSEGNALRVANFEETVATLVHPVEMSLDDLRRVLALIEGQRIGSFEPAKGRPQMIVLDLKLDKKPVYKDNQVFLVNIKLLKREF